MTLILFRFVHYFSHLTICQIKPRSKLVTSETDVRAISADKQRVTNRSTIGFEPTFGGSWKTYNCTQRHLSLLGTRAYLKLHEVRFYSASPLRFCAAVSQVPSINAFCITRPWIESTTFRFQSRHIIY